MQIGSRGGADADEEAAIKATATRPAESGVVHAFGACVKALQQCAEQAKAASENVALRSEAKEDAEAAVRRAKGAAAAAAGDLALESMSAADAAAVAQADADLKRALQAAADPEATADEKIAAMERAEASARTPPALAKALAETKAAVVEASQQVPPPFSLLCVSCTLAAVVLPARARDAG